MTRLALAIATAGGAGLAPVAPGTAGSLVGLLIYFATRRWSPASQLAVLAAITLVGIWASQVAARHYKREDPGQAVIDEVAGQLVTLYFTGAGVWGAIFGFFVFRALDIVKPWPARQFERFPGGIGIMADDLMAGVYGHLLVRAGGHFLPVFFF